MTKKQLFERFNIFSNEELKRKWFSFEDDLKFDREEFIGWHGTTSISEVMESHLFDILDGGLENEYKLEAKIVSGKLEEYPFEDRTTNDGYVEVDAICYNGKKFYAELDHYHSNFLKIGNDFRVVSVKD